MGVWRSTIAVFILGIGMLFVPIFSYAQIGEGAANQTGESSAGNIISGRYVSPHEQLEIQLPSGWSGLGLLGVVMVSPEGLEAWRHPVSMEAAMIIAEFDRGILEQAGAAVQESFSQRLAEDNNLSTGRCEQQAYSYVMLNGMEAIEGISECSSGNGGYSKTKTYAIVTNETMNVIAFTSNSSESYRLHEPEFDDSISTLKINNAVSFKDAMAETLGLKSEDHQVMVKGDQVEVKVKSNSNVSNFSFSEETKQLFFVVEGTNSTNGFAIITVEKVLEPPYTVTIDGQPTTDFFIFKDEIDGENTVQINYQHSSHEIVITGTNVVPEFPLHMVGAIAGVIGIVAIVTRNIRSRHKAAF